MKKNLLLVFLTVFMIGCESSSEIRILFSSSRNDNSDIYIMNSIGEITQQITKDKSEEWAPVWINENEISYLSQNGEQISLMKYDLITKKHSQLKHPDNCLLDDKNILYSPGLKKQVYYCDGEIYLLNEENKKVENLTENIDGNANYVSWVRGKDEITFTSNHEGNNEIYRFNLKTKTFINLTNNSSNDERGDISPDGRLIVFSTDRYEKGNQDIVVQNLITNKVERITNSKGTELIARWSNDNNRIIYGSNKDGNWELYFYNIKEQKEVRLTKNKGFDGDPRVY